MGGRWQIGSVSSWTPTGTPWDNLNSVQSLVVGTQVTAVPALCPLPGLQVLGSMLPSVVQEHLSAPALSV